MPTLCDVLRHLREPREGENQMIDSDTKNPDEVEKGALFAYTST